MLVTTNKDVSILQSNVLTMLILTVLEVIMFYLFYSAKNKKSVEKGVSSAVDKLGEMIPYREQDKEMYRYATVFLKAKQEEAIQTRVKENSDTKVKVIIYVVLLGILANIVFLTSTRPSLNAVIRACVSVVAVLLTQLFLITVIVERLHGDFKGKFAQLVADTLENDNTNAQTVCPM